MSGKSKDKRKNSPPSPPSRITADNWREDTKGEYTEDLWRIPARDRSGEHTGDYHGNFVPQIAHRLIRRFTDPYGFVLDGFAGSGTTLIECRRTGRNGLGFEIGKDIRNSAARRMRSEANPYSVITEIKCADSASRKAQNAGWKFLEKHKRKFFDLLILHPPYSDIIEFTSESNDLSRLKEPSEFVDGFHSVLSNLLPLLKDDGFLAVVIGDKYEKGEVIPLGSLLLTSILETGDVRLKGFIVKDIQQNRAKRNRENLWKYRAFKGDFFIFKHEYVLVLQKKKSAFFGKDKE